MSLNKLITSLFVCYFELNLLLFAYYYSIYEITLLTIFSSRISFLFIATG